MAQVGHTAFPSQIPAAGGAMKDVKPYRMLTHLAVWETHCLTASSSSIAETLPVPITFALFLASVLTAALGNFLSVVNLNSVH